MFPWPVACQAAICLVDLLPHLEGGAQPSGEKPSPTLAHSGCWFLAFDQGVRILRLLNGRRRRFRPVLARLLVRAGVRMPAMHHGRRETTTCRHQVRSFTNQGETIHCRPNHARLGSISSAGCSTRLVLPRMLLPHKPAPAGTHPWNHGMSRPTPPMDKVEQDRDKVLKSMRSAAFPNTWRLYFSSRLLLHSQSCTLLMQGNSRQHE